MCIMGLALCPRRLEAMVADLAVSQPAPHPNFRLWLSTTPSASLPGSLLRAGIQLAWPPLRGVRAILRSTFAAMSPDAFAQATGAMAAWPKLLLRLSLFHAVLLVSLRQDSCVKDVATCCSCVALVG